MVVRKIVRSGYVGIHNGRLGYASLNGYDWSRDALAYSSPVGVHTAGAYHLRFDASGVYPSDYSNRWNGSRRSTTRRRHR